MSLPTPTLTGDLSGFSEEEKSEILNLPSLQDKIRDACSSLPGVHQIEIIVGRPENDEEKLRAWYGKILHMTIAIHTSDGRVVVTRVRRTKKGGKKGKMKWDWRAKWKWSDTTAVLQTSSPNKTTITTVTSDGNDAKVIYKPKSRVIQEIHNSQWKEVAHIVDDMYQKQLRNLLVKRKDDKMTEFGWQVEGKWICRPQAKVVKAILQEWFRYLKPSLPKYQSHMTGYFRSESEYNPKMVRESWMPYIRERDKKIIDMQKRVWKQQGVTDFDASIRDGVEQFLVLDWDENSVRNVASTLTGKQLKKAAGYPWIGLRKRDVLHRSLGLFESKPTEALAAQTLPSLEEVWKWNTSIITPGIRTQAAKSATKSRLIHIVPCDVFLRERSVWYPAWERWESDNRYVQRNLDDIGNVIYNKSSPDIIGSWMKQCSKEHTAAMSIDWSSFDASVSKTAVERIIRDTLSKDLGTWYRKHKFIFKSPWNDINNAEWRNGLLSGSQLTSWIGSKWNAAVIRYCLKEIGISDYEASVQGDDGLIFFKRDDRSVNDIVAEFANVAKRIGLTMHPDKVYAVRISDTKHLFSPDDPLAEYLKRWYFQDGSHRLFVCRAMNRLFRRERKLDVDRVSEEEEQYLAEKFSDHVAVLKHYDPNLDGLYFAIKKVLNKHVATVVIDKLLKANEKGDIEW